MLLLFSIYMHAEHIYVRRKNGETTRTESERFWSKRSGGKGGNFYIYYIMP